MQNSRADNKAMVRTLSITGLMIAVSFIMSIPPWGTIPTPFAAATIAFLPAIVTVMLEGFVPGLVVGAAAGTFSMVRAFVAPMGILAPFFQNPLVSVLPRAMIAVTVFFVFRMLIKMKLPRVAAVGVAAAVGSITNTVGALGIMWLVYAVPLQQTVWDNTAHATVWAFFAVVLTTNAVAEVAANTVLAVLIVMTMRAAKLSKYS